MKHFGPLLKRLRGATPLREIGRRTGLTHSYLSKLERGAVLPREPRARQLLRQAFGLGDREIERALIEVSLEDVGLEDAELRQLVADLIQRELPPSARRRLHALYRRYSHHRRDSHRSESRPGRSDRGAGVA